MIYLLIAIFILFGVVHFDILNNNIGRKGYWILTFIILVLLLGFRYRVGGDSLSYEDAYPGMPDFRDIKLYGFYYTERLFAYQPFWIILVAFAKLIGKDYYIFQFLHAILVNIVLSYFLFKNSKTPFSVLLFLFITHYYFYLTIEVEREILAICVFLLNLKNLEEKKWLKYYCLAFISFMFHMSAIFIFILPIFRVITFTKKTIVTIILLLTPLIFFKNFFIEILKPILFLESMESKFKGYQEIEFSITGTIAYYTVRVICFIPILFYGINKNYKSNWMLNAYIIVSVLSLALVGFERFLNYLIIPYIILFIDILYSLNIQFRNIFFRYIFVFLVFCNIFFSIPWRLFTTSMTGDKYYYLFFPYVSVFDKHIIKEREKYMVNQWDL